jgi:hypothetical protein
LKEANGNSKSQKPAKEMKSDIDGLISRFDVD